LDNPEAIAFEASLSTESAITLYNETDWVLATNGQVERATTKVADVKPAHVRPILTKSYQRGALFTGDLFERFHVFHVDSSDNSDGEEPTVQWKKEVGTPAPQKSKVFRKSATSASTAPTSVSTATTAPQKSALKKGSTKKQSAGVQFAAPEEKVAPPQEEALHQEESSDAEVLQVAEDATDYRFNPQFADYGFDDDNGSAAGSGHNRLKQPWYTSSGGINTFGKFPKSFELTFRAHDLDAVTKGTSDPYLVLSRSKPVPISKATARRAGKPVQIHKSETKKKSLDVTWNPFTVSPDALSGTRHELDNKIKASVYSNLPFTTFGTNKAILLGECTFTLREVMDAYHPNGSHPELPLRWPLINISRAHDTHSGQLMLTGYTVDGIDVDSSTNPPFTHLSQGDAGLF